MLIFNFQSESIKKGKLKYYRCVAEDFFGVCQKSPRDLRNFPEKQPGESVPKKGF